MVIETSVEVIINFEEDSLPNITVPSPNKGTPRTQ
ncbi:hypothetical protein C5167_010218 [Papaver somniferum]|uniref:Uncharacterized protein n=1 Tax=Papaver somniferum TaxID=3469 RepID=A0A4Y7K3N3_PAPSO|nr:hypothetical protein C5167_010218 [Papaver somniferum]